MYKEERKLVFNLGNGKYVIKTTEKHSDGGTELDRNQRPHVLGTAVTYSFNPYVVGQLILRYILEKEDTGLVVSTHTCYPNIPKSPPLAQELSQG